MLCQQSTMIMARESSALKREKVNQGEHYELQFEAGHVSSKPNSVKKVKPSSNPDKNDRKAKNAKGR